MSENPSPSPAEPEAIPHAHHLPTRGKQVLWLLLCVTLVAVTLVWWFPNESLLHFWVVTQILPLLYCALTYWGSHGD
jgi:hypothetical protein